VNAVASIIVNIFMMHSYYGANAHTTRLQQYRFIWQ